VKKPVLVGIDVSAKTLDVSIGRRAPGGVRALRQRRAGPSKADSPGRRIRGGRASVRTALYLAAKTGVRFNPVSRELYEQDRLLVPHYEEMNVHHARALRGGFLDAPGFELRYLTGAWPAPRPTRPLAPHGPGNTIVPDRLGCSRRTCPHRTSYSV